MSNFLGNLIRSIKDKTSRPSNNPKTWREVMLKSNSAFWLKSDPKKVMGLIKNGKYNDIKSAVMPSGTSGGFIDLISKTTEGIMEESCRDLGIGETDRLELSSIIAYGSTYSQRSESIADDFIKKVEEKNIQLSFPKDLVEYMETNHRKKKYSLRDITGIYINYYITKEQSKAQLEKYKELGIKKVKILTCNDGARGCNKCKKHHNVNHLVSKVPLLPLCWGCRCIYRPIIK